MLAFWYFKTRKKGLIFLWENKLQEPKLDFKKPFLKENDKISKKSLDFYFYFHIYCHCHHRQMDLRIWCSWCSIADFSSVCTGSSPVIRYLDYLSIVQMLANILWGVLMCWVGFLLCYYSAWIVREFGRIAWAELHLGGTRNLILVVGFVFLVLGVSMMFGMFAVTNPVDQIATGFVAY